VYCSFFGAIRKDGEGARHGAGKPGLCVPDCVPVAPVHGGPRPSTDVDRGSPAISYGGERPQTPHQRTGDRSAPRRDDSRPAPEPVRACCGAAVRSGRASRHTRVGRRVDGEVTWLDTVDTELLPGPAREALERGDTDDHAPLTALRGVVQAEVQRGS
jgi:hypothetical protein